jgi:hypothetical protein
MRREQVEAEGGVDVKAPKQNNDRKKIIDQNGVDVKPPKQNNDLEIQNIRRNFYVV